jgi:uncharacterized membrane protein
VSAALGQRQGTRVARRPDGGRTPLRLQLSWGLMALLVLAVAGYALALLTAPPARNGFVRDLLSLSPLAAPLHFGGGALALVAGALQAHRGLRLRRPAFHRWTGRLYLLAVLASGGAGLLLATRSSAGPIAQWGFGVMAVLWLLTTVVGWRRARAGRYQDHRDWMIRSYALTLAAVTLRVWLPLSQVAGIPFLTAYVAIAWLCWVPNLLVAEWFLRSRPRGPVRATAAMEPAPR